MNPSELFIKRPVTTILLMLGLMKTADPKRLQEYFMVY